MDGTELYAAALEIRVLVLIVTKLAGRNLEQRLQDNGAPISRIQYGVLRLLSHQPYTLSELSRKLILDPATLVPVVDALEQHGYARRGKDPHDRRRAPIALTEHGRELLARVPILDQSDALIKSLVAMGEQPIQQLRVLLREFVQHLGADERILEEVASIVQIAHDLYPAHEASCPFQSLFSDMPAHAAQSDEQREKEASGSA